MKYPNRWENPTLTRQQSTLKTTSNYTQKTQLDKFARILLCLSLHAPLRIPIATVHCRSEQKRCEPIKSINKEKEK